MTTAPPLPQTEISIYLQHGDYSVALRRIMDLALDTRNHDFIRAATQLSRTFRTRIQRDELSTWENEFLQAAENVAQTMRNAYDTTMQSTCLIEAKGITKSYRAGAFALKPITMQLHSGKIMGVVGENGNGKTTLLRCLAGQLAIDGGTIQYSELRNPDFYAIKSYVAFIPQRIPRWYGQLKDNLHFSAAIAGIKGAANDLMVEFMLERFGLTEYAALNWSQISSGYRTRFEIARVLLLQPQVLILDEPLANLDINAQQTLLSDLRFLTKSTANKIGIVLTSQQLHEVEKVADSVMLIRQGSCILQSGQEDLSKLGYALELETPHSREELGQALQELSVDIQFNGGFFTLVSHTHTSQELMRKLVMANIQITYCRDITTSTKRLF